MILENVTYLALLAILGGSAVVGALLVMSSFAKSLVQQVQNYYKPRKILATIQVEEASPGEWEDARVASSYHTGDTYTVSNLPN